MRTNNITVISSRIKGRIDRLFVRNPGEKIAKGQQLFAIYSEELLADEKDFLNAIEQQTKFSSQQKIVDELADASKKKLKLWGWSEQQINQLTTTKQISATFSYTSSESGFLLELKINEGAYIEAGTPLFKIVFRFAILNKGVPISTYAPSLIFKSNKNPLSVLA